jgi:hypothetical protein
MKKFTPIIVAMLVGGFLVMWAGNMMFAFTGLTASRQALNEINTKRRYMGCFENDVPNNREMEWHGSLKLPASAQSVEPYSEDFCTTFYLRFQMARPDFTKFIGTTAVGLPMSTTTLPRDFDYLPEGLGWQIDTTSTFWAGESNDEFFRRQAIFIDRSDPAVWTVYVIVRETIY